MSFFSSHSFMHYSNKSYQTEWSFLNQKKGKQKLAFEGYIYICDRTTENKTYWKCESGYMYICGRKTENKTYWKCESGFNILTTYQQ